jgi:hypothetical protein
MMGLGKGDRSLIKGMIMSFDGTEPLENTQIPLEGLRLHMEIA